MSSHALSAAQFGSTPENWTVHVADLDLGGHSATHHNVPTEQVREVSDAYRSRPHLKEVVSEASHQGSCKSAGCGLLADPAKGREFSDLGLITDDGAHGAFRMITRRESVMKRRGEL